MKILALHCDYIKFKPLKKALKSINSLSEKEKQGENVKEALVIRDRESNNSRGFGFVTMGTPEEAKKVIDELDGKELKGRNLIIRQAKPRAQ